MRSVDSSEFELGLAFCPNEKLDDAEGDDGELGCVMPPSGIPPG